VCCRCTPLSTGPNAALAPQHVREPLSAVTNRGSDFPVSVPTFGLVLDRFETGERLEAIVKQPTGVLSIMDGFSWSTCAGYRSYLKTHVRPKWEATPISSGVLI
jgi:hypothetical protein